MDRFFFDVQHGGDKAVDEDGLSLSGAEAAADEALWLLIEVIHRGDAKQAWGSSVAVRNDQGQELFKVSAALSVAAASRRLSTRIDNLPRF